MLEKLAGSLLDADDARVMGVEALIATEAKARKLAATAAGFTLPYHDVYGKRTGFYRFRYVEDTRKGFDAVTGRKPLRYTQPPNTESEVYFPPQPKANVFQWAKALNNLRVPITITEGELKAACATKAGLPTIGLGGVWSFQSNKHNQLLVPAFEQFSWYNKDAAGTEEDPVSRTVYICFDSDAVTNPDVLKAEHRLASRLTALGATVKIVRLIAPEEITKVGLDDFIVLHGPKAALLHIRDHAFPWQESAVLHELNQRVIYVRDPGYLYDHQSRLRLSANGFKEHAFSNVHFTKTTYDAKGMPRPVKTPAAPAWLQWEHRAEVAGQVFAPGQDRITAGGYLNVWQGWGIEKPAPGDVSPWHELMTHLFGKGEGATAARLYFERWCAAPFQQPGLKMAVACSIWGSTHGSGKTLVGHTLMRIYGKHAAELKDSDLDEERNEWAENKQFVLADDITARGDRKFMRRLMTMITQKWIRLNPKYINSFSVVDLINYYFTSNDPDALYMDDEDRRFFVWETLAGKFVNYRRYVAWRDSEEGMAALWHYFLDMDLGDFDPQAPAPMTQGKHSMINLGKSDLGAWVRDLKDHGGVLLAKAGLKGDLFTAKELHALYDPTGEKKASPNALARELKRAGFHPPANGSSIKLPDGSNTMVYAVLNPAHWAAARWIEAVNHYTASHPALSAPTKKAKF